MAPTYCKGNMDMSRTLNAARNMMNGQKRQENGFTLLELLIVIGILAIVAAVAIPNLTQFAGAGKQESWYVDQKALQNCVVSYRLNYGFYPTNSGEALSTPLEDDHADYGNDGVGDCCIVFSGSACGGTDNGLADVGYLLDAPECSTNTGYGDGKNPGGDVGSYVWWIDGAGIVRSWYDADTEGDYDAVTETDFYDSIYP